MTFLATKIISAFLLPPLSLLLVFGLGIVLLNTCPRLGRRLVLAAWLLLYTLSTPFVGGMLLQSLEEIPPLPLRASASSADAIVVLGAGRYFSAPEYGRDTLRGSDLERLRYAARLYRATGKPILVSGGKPGGGTLAEGVVMKEALENDFDVPVEWVEDQSNTTLENARLSAPLLQPHGITRIYVVTHAWHMARARIAFERAGFQVIPAPTMFTTSGAPGPLSFLPSSTGLAMSSTALREWIGQWWYWLR